MSLVLQGSALLRAVPVTSSSWAVLDGCWQGCLVLCWGGRRMLGVGRAGCERLCPHCRGQRLDLAPLPWGGRGDGQQVHEGGLRVMGQDGAAPSSARLMHGGDAAVEVEPVLSWARCLPYPYPQGIAACPSVPLTGLTEALEGPICGVGAPQTCRDPQGDPCGLGAAEGWTGEQCKSPPKPAPCHVPAYQEKRQAGRDPSGAGAQGRALPAPHLPALQPCPTTSPPGSGADKGQDRLKGRGGVPACP